MIISPAIQALQLSKNFPDLNISIDEPDVSVLLQKNGATVLEESYINGPTGSFDLKLKSVLHSLLTAQVPTAAAIEEITGSVAEFSLTIDVEAPVVFKAIKGGVDIDNYALQANYAGAFLKSRFLTWQPAVKKVSSLANQYLTYYSTARCTLTYQVLPTNTVYDTIIFDAGKQYRINVGALPYAETGITGIKLWTVFLDDSTSQVQEYSIEAPMSETTDLFLFENSLGGIDTAEFTGSITEMDDHDIQKAVINDEMQEYDITPLRTFKKNTGFIATEAERLWLRDFFSSLQKWHYTGGRLRKLYVKSWENESERGELNSYSFTFAYAKDDGTNYIL